MKSAILKRSIFLDGHKTSVSLEDAFWSDLKDIASSQGVTLSELVGAIDATRQQNNLSSAIRLFVLSTSKKRKQAHRGQLTSRGLICVRLYQIRSQTLRPNSYLQNTTV
jgi:predicted DNA-binding ribbon-helix-helix protein